MTQSIHPEIEVPETGRTIYPNVFIGSHQLQVGDIVRQAKFTDHVFVSGSAPVDPGPWTTCIVEKVFEDRVELFRPYGHAASFTTGATDNRRPWDPTRRQEGSAVITYTGAETYSVERALDRRDMDGPRWLLYQRTGLK